MLLLKRDQRGGMEDKIGAIASGTSAVTDGSDWRSAWQGGEMRQEGKAKAAPFPISICILHSIFIVTKAEVIYNRIDNYETLHHSL